MRVRPITAHAHRAHPAVRIQHRIADVERVERPGDPRAMPRTARARRREQRAHDLVIRDRRELRNHVGLAGAVVAHRAGRNNQVAERELRCEAAAVADADEGVRAELDQFFENHRRARRADARGGGAQRHAAELARDHAVLAHAAHLARVLPARADARHALRIAAQEHVRRDAVGGEAGNGLGLGQRWLLPRARQRPARGRSSQARGTGKSPQVRPETPRPKGSLPGFPQGPGLPRRKPRAKSGRLSGRDLGVHRAPKDGKLETRPSGCRAGAQWPKDS